MAHSRLRKIRFVGGPSVLTRGPAVIAALEVDSVELSTLAPFPSQRVLALCRQLIESAGFDLPGTRVTGSRLVLPCPREELGDTLLDVVNEVLAAEPRAWSAIGSRGLERLLARWESPAEAALLAVEASRAHVPIRWADPSSRYLTLGQGRRAIAYQRCHLSIEAAGRELVDDKLTCARLLEDAGVTTSRPRAIASAEEAVHAAEELGYPVVIKPARGFAQVGVFTELSTPDAVRSAFAHAALQSGPLGGELLIERHRYGSYLRATLVGGRLEAVLTSDAPECSADGESTVEELFRRTHAIDGGVQLPQGIAYVLDSMLEAQALAHGDVPERGRRIKLGHQNHGMPVDVTRRIHRELRALLERIARLIPLPLMGIDLIKRSISERFDPDADVILEVNAGPAFSLHERIEGARSHALAKKILRALFADPEASRVPIVAGPKGTAGELEALARSLAERGLHPTGLTRRRAWSGAPAHLLAHGEEAARFFAADSAADVLLLEVEGELAIERGLPVDRFDYVVGGSPPSELEALFRRLTVRDRASARFSADDVAGRALMHSDRRSRARDGSAPAARPLAASGARPGAGKRAATPPDRSRADRSANGADRSTTRRRREGEGRRSRPAAQSRAAPRSRDPGDRR
jgi:D-alanine-D-alanine ligase-like ATP-grasp enzyme